MTLVRSACCDHRALDHFYRGGQPLAGAKCTIPDCTCAGWIPRKGNGAGRLKAGRVERVRDLYAAGLSTTEIRDRLGVGESAVTNALRGRLVRGRAR